jgi:YesN/AraC family two-component response regulator
MKSKEENPGKLTILVIDDEPSLLEGIKCFLESNQYAVLTASNGLAGISIIGDKKIDLVVTDIIMPEMDGMELISYLKKSNPEIHIISMSGGGRFQQEFYSEVAAMLGIDAFLKKPFTTQMLLSTIKQVSG